MILQRKTFAFVQAKTGQDAGLDPNQFCGYAAAFGNVDSYGDVIDRGAFAKTIQKFLADGAVCWQHDWTEPIGRPLDMYEDATGLFIKGQISTTNRGTDALTLLRDGVVKKMSIGYMPDGYSTLSDDQGIALLGQAAYDEALRSLPWWSDGIRLLTQITLYEVSLVTVPANDDASVTGVKGNSLAGSTLDDHFQTVLAAEREYITRVKGIVELRKSDGRQLSVAHRERLEQMLDEQKRHALALDELLTLAAPPPDTRTDEAVAEAEQKARRAEALKERARLERTLARLNGVA